MVENDYIVLKWGTLKSWKITSKEGKKLLEKYCKLGNCISAIAHNMIL